MGTERIDYYTEWNHFANEKRYGAPADPWTPLQVDPNAIEHYNHEIGLGWGLGRIESGNWDSRENCSRLSETATYKGLTQRFEKGYDWEDTALYRRAKERFENRDSFRGYDSLEQYRRVRCEYTDRLFRSIEQDGYRPNEAATHEKPTEDNPFENVYVHRLEPLVVIGRFGDIYWNEGYHRLVIASLVGVSEVPVYVLCRHDQWQQTRDRIYNASASDLEAHPDHPDLRDVL